MLPMVAKRHLELTALRTQSARLHTVLAALRPGGIARRLSVTNAADILVDEFLSIDAARAHIYAWTFPRRIDDPYRGLVWLTVDGASGRDVHEVHFNIEAACEEQWATKPLVTREASLVGLARFGPAAS